MASSYTTSYGLEKIGSGEQSGAWGTTTNHNIDILDRIASYTAVALSGTTHTLTVREASPGSGTENLQDGMYRVIKFTGALGGNNTVTVAPNTTASFFIIINATTDSGSSGPYSVVLSQGSGANITVANGKSAVVYMDGAGSGAAVIDAVSNLALATITASGDITSAGTVNVTGDTATGDDASIGYTSSEGLILTGQGSTNDVTIKNDADAAVITIATGGTNVDIVGDVTASTVNADGDTAAGDNAVMGYTSAEGLILTGQGSTNDVTIKNDADTIVLNVPTGGTAVVVPGTIELGAATDTTLSRSAAGVVDVEGNKLLQAGTSTIWVPAAAMRPTSSNGCADITDVETTSGRPDLQVLDFDDAADEHAQFQVGFPKSWNEGTVTYRIFWTTTATDTDGVAWALQGVSVANDATIDVAYGTAIVVTDDNISAAEDCLVTATSAAVTIASAAVDTMTFIRVFRDVSNANDDMTEDARLIGVQMFYTIDAVNDG
jgi:hypothetical protein